MLQHKGSSTCPALSSRRYGAHCMEEGCNVQRDICLSWAPNVCTCFSGDKQGRLTTSSGNLSWKISISAASTVEQPSIRKRRWRRRLELGPGPGPLLLLLLLLLLRRRRLLLVVQSQYYSGSSSCPGGCCGCRYGDVAEWLCGN